MDIKFIMGQGDGLDRQAAEGDMATLLSRGLHERLVRTAMTKVVGFAGDFFGDEVGEISVGEMDAWVPQYLEEFEDAQSLGLFQAGGVEEKDHLLLWTLGRVFRPEVYVESGVFMGSSLHAFLTCPGLKKVLALDPNLGILKIPADRVPGGELIDNQDFSQLGINFSGIRTLVFFDDHIDSAARIIQAGDMGVRYVMFDDSVGIEGVCQRMYPAVPTIPMIMNPDMLEPGDQLSWVYSPDPGPGGGGSSRTRLKLEITPEFIQKCRMAGSRVRRCMMLPSLAEFIPQWQPHKGLDTSKYILELGGPD